MVESWPYSRYNRICAPLWSCFDSYTRSINWKTKRSRRIVSISRRCLDVKQAGVPFCSEQHRIECHYRLDVDKQHFFSPRIRPRAPLWIVLINRAAAYRTFADRIEYRIGINRYISINFPLFLPVFNIILCYILNIIARNNISNENIFRKNAHFSTDGAFSNRKTVEDILSEYFNSNSKLIIVISKLGASLFYTTRLCLCYAALSSRVGKQTWTPNTRP